jgi:hypothetical protein
VVKLRISIALNIVLAVAVVYLLIQNVDLGLRGEFNRVNGAQGDRIFDGEHGIDGFGKPDLRMNPPFPPKLDLRLNAPNQTLYLGKKAEPSQATEPLRGNGGHGNNPAPVITPPAAQQP